MRLGPVGLALLVGLTTGTAARAADGRAIFEDCRSCHSLEAGAPPAAGPNLAGIVGRLVAGDAGFGYSPSFESLRGRGARWNRETLDRFLEDPEEAVPGTWMSARVRDAEDRRALIDFLSDPNAR